jgi:hypothetical protein
MVVVSLVFPVASYILDSRSRSHSLERPLGTDQKATTKTCSFYPKDQKRKNPVIYGRKLKTVFALL